MIDVCSISDNWHVQLRQPTVNVFGINEIYRQYIAEINTKGTQ